MIFIVQRSKYNFENIMSPHHMLKNGKLLFCLINLCTDYLSCNNEDFTGREIQTPFLPSK